MLKKIWFRIFILLMVFLNGSICNSQSKDIYRKVIIKEHIINGIKYEHFNVQISEKETINIAKSELAKSKYFLSLSPNESNCILYPNPTVDILNFNIKENLGKIQNISVFDLVGKIMDNYIEHNTANNYLDVQKLPKGAYLISISLTNGTIHNLQFIKQ